MKIVVLLILTNVVTLLLLFRAWQLIENAVTKDDIAKIRRELEELQR